MVSSDPRQLTVLYDENCELCRRCRRWMEGQEQLVPLVFVAAGSPAAWALVQAWSVVAGGRDLPVGDELVVFSGEGAVWTGPDAFIICLWALTEHRSAAHRLSTPVMKPVAKRLFHALSAGRGTISSLLAEGQDELAAPDNVCADSCNPSPTGQTESCG